MVINIFEFFAGPVNWCGDGCFVFKVSLELAFLVPLFFIPTYLILRKLVFKKTNVQSLAGSRTTTILLSAILTVIMIYTIPSLFLSAAWNVTNITKARNIDHGIYKPDKIPDGYALVNDGFKNPVPLDDTSGTTYYAAEYWYNPGNKWTYDAPYRPFSITENGDDLKSIIGDSCTTEDPFGQKCEKIPLNKGMWYKIYSSYSDQSPKFIAVKTIEDTAIRIIYGENVLTDDSVSRIFDSMRKLNPKSPIYKYGIRCSFPNFEPNCTN